MIVSGGLGWSVGLGVGRVGCGFAVVVPYGSALVAMATREGRRWRYGIERWETMVAVWTGDRKEAGTAGSCGQLGRLARTCGRFCHTRTCGLWLRVPGRGRAGGFFSMPHEACGTTTRYTTRVAVIGVLLTITRKHNSDGNVVIPDYIITLFPYLLSYNSSF